MACFAYSQTNLTNARSMNLSSPEPSVYYEIIFP